MNYSLTAFGTKNKTIGAGFFVFSPLNSLRGCASKIFTTVVSWVFSVSSLLALALIFIVALLKMYLRR
jgi:hypothetical protein